ncbi:MAG TPA: ABC transporter permease, partial [Halanaerobiales bacterium]|nr:ABC transporter permease [Halanaerobiales bacterium]
LSHPGGFCPRMFTNAWLTELGGIVPLSIIYFFILILFTYFILNHTRFGRRVYAIGGDEEKAKIAGINVDKVKIKVYMASSLLAGIAGLALAARMRSGDPVSGSTFTLYSVAAVLIGGTTFSGGKGGVIRTFAGVLILSLVSIILNLIGVSPFYQNVMTGLIIVLAVINSSLRKG